MFCSHCGKEIPCAAAFCPFCGASIPIRTPSPDERPTAAKPQRPRPAPYSTLAIVSLIFSILSLFLFFYCILGTVGLILSIVALVRCRRSGARGMELAIAGIVLSSTSILLGVFILIIQFSIVSFLFDVITYFS